MDELSEEMPADQKPIDIKLSKLPSCLLVILLGVLVDIPSITIVALCKSPYMLLKGWKRLLEDLIGREGPFLETVCVPFAALSIFLWPLAVVGAVISALFTSFFLGLYSAVIVQQEGSFWMGVAYIVSIISLFDEYTNDLLYLREGSCFPRPRYRRNMVSGESVERRKSIVDDVRNADDVELTRSNCPKEKLFEWFIEPLLIMKEQIKGLQLNENEETCLKMLIMQCKNDKPEEWDDSGFASSNNVRRAQLQAIIRRLQGMVGSMSRMPTFRRRFQNLVKVLCVEAIRTGILANNLGVRLKTRHGGKNGEAVAEKSELKAEDGNIV
ncbi:hypothetical protein U1Q18_042038 [Sarracenia purpurea var. burkii]